MSKYIIPDELVESFSSAIKDGSDADVNLTWDILENRDKNNVESERNFKKITQQIIDNQTLFDTKVKQIWIIKAEGKPRRINGKETFESEDSAKRHLSLHLTNLVGLDPLVKYKADINRFLRLKQNSDKQTEEMRKRHGYDRWSNIRIGGYGGIQVDSSYDPKWTDKDTKKLMDQINDLEQVYNETSYIKTLRNIFKGGQKLRNLLLENKIITIERIL